MVTVYRGVPWELPAGIRLYERYFVSGVPASDMSAGQRDRLLDHRLRSRNDVRDLIGDLERVAWMTDPTISRRVGHAGRRWTPRGVSPMPPASPSTPRIAQHPSIAPHASTISWISHPDR